jgi:hypothetical protein
MNAQAGPSRSLPSRTIDLASIPLDRSRFTNSISSSSIAPSLCTHRSSTQSTEGWGGLHTPRSERMSLCISECSITEEDVVVIGPGSLKDQADTPVDSVILEDAQIVGLWLDLVSHLSSRIKRPWLTSQDKTPKPSDHIFNTPKFPSRISSLPKQQPFHIPPQQRSIRFHDPPEQRLKPLPNPTQARLDKPLPLLISSPIHTDKALPPAPILYEIDEPPPALPDDSPLIPSCMLERYVPSMNLIPPFDPDAARKRLALSTMRDELSRIPVTRPTSTSDLQPNATEVVVIVDPPPPIPPRRSSRKERSGQSIPTDQKMVSSTSLASLGGSTDKRSSSTSSDSLEPAADIRVTSSTSLVSLGQAPPLPPPRASSLRSASARAAIAASDSNAVIVIPGPAKETSPTIEPLQSPLSRRPRVRSRSAQLPPPTTMTATMRDRQHSSSHMSLSSILEDEGLPDMEATPNGSWSLRRNRLRLARARSQPRMRTRDECGPWRTMREMRSHGVSLELV